MGGLKERSVAIPLLEPCAAFTAYGDAARFLFEHDVPKREIEIIVSELANDILKNGGGKIVLTCAKRHLSLTAFGVSRSFVDAERSHIQGYKPQASIGCGICLLERFFDEVSVLFEQDGSPIIEGTRYCPDAD